MARENVFYVGNMCCPTEEQIIRNRLKSVEAIDELEFDLMNRRLTVQHRLNDESSILKALESIGMDPKLITEDNHDDHDHGASISVRDRWLMGAAGVLALFAEVLAFSGQGDNSWPVIALALGSIVLGGRETIKKGLISLRTLTLNINFLMTIAITGAVVIGQWPEAAMVTFLFGLAEMIEAFSLERARNAIQSLMEMSPEVALVQNAEGTWEEIEASKVSVGQRVRVRPGERIPLDGTVLLGSSTVNQAPITGESMPVAKQVGDTLFAGTVNEKGSLEFEVSADASQTTLARIIRAVQQAQSQKAPTQRFIDKFARYYTPTVVVLAVLIAAIPPLFMGEAFQPWLYKALVLLVIACPCALVISTPVTVVSALASAARRGILVKGGIYIEEGRRISTLALDKTGTLTHGEPKVTDVIPLGATDKQELLRIAASLDAPSEHPVASAVVAAYEGNPLPVEEFESITGRGVRGQVAGNLYFIGNHRLAHEQGFCNTEVENHLSRLESEGKTAVVVGSRESALGVIAVADTLRATSVEAIKTLHDLGVKTLMLTGDNDLTAKAIAKQVGIDDARGDLLPEDKLKVIDELNAQGKHVGMVGDGINDAPALARATIGFAMGAAGTDTAIETADVALMKDDLRKIPEFISLSRKASAVLTQNITFAIGIKAIFFGLAFFGKATLWMAVFADMGASLLVVGNGLRLLQGSRST